MKPIKGYEGLYSITKDGRVYSHRRKVKSPSGHRVVKGGWKKPTLGNHGYLTVDLYKKGKRKNLLVHRLVGEAFIDNPLNNPQINHLNGIKTNNHVENIKWVTGKENHAHASINGLLASGERNGNSKVTEKQVRAMRIHHETKRKYGEKTWNKYNISQSHYYKIIDRRRWNIIE